MEWTQAPGRSSPGPVRRLLLALAPLLLVLEIPGAAELWNRPDTGLRLRDQTVVVVTAGGAGDRAGIRVGDTVIRVGNTPTPDYNSYIAALRDRSPGDSVAFTVDRAGAPVERNVILAARTAAQNLRGYFMSLTGLSFLFLGFVTYLRRGDALGRLFYGTCLIFSYLLLDLPTFPSPWLRAFLELLRDVGGLFLPALLLRFFLVFPEGIGEDDPARTRHRLLMVPPVVLAALHATLALSGVGPASVLHQIVAVASAVLLLTYLVACVAVFARKIRRRDQGQIVLWTKLRLALVGLTAGLLPFAAVTLLKNLRPWSDPTAEIATILLLPLIPASLSMALLRGGAIDLGFLIRQALIAMALTLPLVIVGSAVVLLLGPTLSGVGRGFGYLLAAAVVFALSLGATSTRRAVARLIDRIFFPDRTARRERTTQVMASLSQLRDPSKLAELLCRELRDLLGTSCVALYRVRAEQLELMHVDTITEHRAPPPDALPLDSTLVRRALDSRGPLLVEPLVSGPRPLPLDDRSLRLLATTDAVLLAPLVAGGEPVALLALAPPRRGGTYDTLALHLLQVVSGQAAAAFENADLHRQDVERVRLGAEMNMARQIQTHLMPASDLEVGPFHLSGRMVSSYEVGGDVFDYFPLDDGRVLLVVADAAGKGVPASLMMSSLRSAVRETLRPGMGADQAASHLNNLVHEMTGVQHFIALFLGLLQPGTGVLEYVVAGIELPLWVRASEDRTERLNRGGPVLGVDPRASYRSGVVRLARGDVLLAFTDGMIDQEDEHEQEFGVGRLEKAALLAKGGTARTIRDDLFRAVEEFGSGDSVDDRTVLVLKFRDSGWSGMLDARTAAEG